MTWLDMVRTAVHELGDAAPDPDVSAFVLDRYGIQLEARFMPIYRAAVRGEELTRLAREKAAQLAAEFREKTPSRRRARRAGSAGSIDKSI